MGMGPEPQVRLAVHEREEAAPMAVGALNYIVICREHLPPISSRSFTLRIDTPCYLPSLGCASLSRSHTCLFQLMHTQSCFIKREDVRLDFSRVVNTLISRPPRKMNCQALYTFNSLVGNSAIGFASINLGLRTCVDIRDACQPALTSMTVL